MAAVGNFKVGDWFAYSLFIVCNIVISPAAGTNSNQSTVTRGMFYRIPTCEAWKIIILKIIISTDSRKYSPVEKLPQTALHN
jgi:hypothetical protein